MRGGLNENSSKTGADGIKNPQTEGICGKHRKVKHACKDMLHRRKSIIGHFRSECKKK